MTQAQEVVEITSVTTRNQGHANIVPHMWKPGQSGNPKGKPRGSKHKLAEHFITALQDDFKVNGVQAIEKVRETRPADYLKIIASIVPKEFTFREEGSTKQATDDELFEKLNAIRHSLLEGIGVEDRPGDESSPSKEATDIEPV